MNYHLIAKLAYNMGGRKYVNWFLKKIDKENKFADKAMLLGDLYFQKKKNAN